jgi:hypothetical protein
VLWFSHGIPRRLNYRALKSWCCQLLWKNKERHQRPVVVAQFVWKIREGFAQKESSVAFLHPILAQPIRGVSVEAWLVGRCQTLESFSDVDGHAKVKKMLLIVQPQDETNIQVSISTPINCDCVFRWNVRLRRSTMFLPTYLMTNPSNTKQKEIWLVREWRVPV